MIRKKCVVLKCAPMRGAPLVLCLVLAGPLLAAEMEAGISHVVVVPMGDLGDLEIVDSRVAGWDIKITDTVADNASSGLYVLGDHAAPLAAYRHFLRVLGGDGGKDEVVGVGRRGGVDLWLGWLSGEPASDAVVRSAV